MPKAYAMIRFHLKDGSYWNLPLVNHLVREDNLPDAYDLFHHWAQGFIAPYRGKLYFKILAVTTEELMYREANGDEHYTSIWTPQDGAFLSLAEAINKL